ncbi:MAG: hypothetical protein WC781_04615 [Candidatus Pacearchaeota archaeon]|jgi:hypothetical protein
MTDEKQIEAEKVIERLFGKDELMKKFMGGLMHEADIERRVREIRRRYDESDKNHESFCKYEKEAFGLIKSEPKEKQDNYYHVWYNPKEYDRTWRR